MLALMLVACGDPAADRARYVAALTSGDCATVTTPTLQADCWTALAARKPEAAPTLDQKRAHCAQIDDENARGECLFVLAEANTALDVCKEAGPYADDCALHLVSRAFAAEKHPSEEFAAAAIATAGLAADDPRPWSAYFREVLGREQPLDRARCVLAGTPARVEACRQTALGLFADRLNQARDRRQFTCVDGVPKPPWPARVAWVADPDLNGAFTARTDLCTPLDRPPAR